MPKETIPADSPDSPFVAQVGWYNQEGVQVGVESAAGFSLVTHLYGNQDACEKIGMEVYGLVQLHRNPDHSGGLHGGEPAQAFGRDILNIIESSVISPHGSYTGVWAHLNRHGCNELIRIVRKARDRAFGRDE